MSLECSMQHVCAYATGNDRHLSWMAQFFRSISGSCGTTVKTTFTHTHKKNSQTLHINARPPYMTFNWGLSRMLENIALLKLGHIKRAIVVGRAPPPPLKILFHNVHLHRIIFQRMELAWITPPADLFHMLRATSLTL